MAKLKLTEQQQAAVENRGGSLLVSAAAGSGKTKVLVERVFAYLMEEHCHIDDFLIITFTRAAAADNDRVEVAAVLSSVQTHTDILREDLVVLWCGCPVFSVDGSGRAPLGRTVFLAPTVIAAGR